MDAAEARVPRNAFEQSPRQRATVSWSIELCRSIFDSHSRPDTFRITAFYSVFLSHGGFGSDAARSNGVFGNSGDRFSPNTTLSIKYDSTEDLIGSAQCSAYPIGKTFAVLPERFLLRTHCYSPSRSPYRWHCLSLDPIASKQATKEVLLQVLHHISRH